MKLHGAAFALILWASSAVAAPLPTLSFDTPAHLHGGVEATGLQWALFYIGGPTSIQLSEIKDGSVLNKTLTMATVRVPEAGQFEVPGGWQPSDPVPLPSPFFATLALAPERSSALLVIADSVAVVAGPTRGQMVRMADDADAETPLASQPKTPASHARPVEASGVGVGLLPKEGNPTGFRLAAKGIRALEWFGAEVDCFTERSCPEGGGAWDYGVGTLRGDEANATRRSWMYLTAASGDLVGSGAAWAVAAGGAMVDVRVDGGLRLPRAEHEGACPGCVELADGTLGMEGNLTLRSLAPDGEPGRLRSGLEGTPTAARVDEAGVDAATLFGLRPAVAVAGAVVLAGAAKLLLGLFARAVHDPLANPRRKAIYDAVRAHPGLAFSDLLRLCGIANGVARHHLRLLEQKGLVVRHPVGKTVRIFENHGRYDRDWRTVAALRDPQLRLLHAWLKAAGPSRQLDAIQAATEWGWSPTATKRRLESLAGAGLLASRREGRLRWYTAQG